MGCDKGLSRAGILVANKWVDKVIEVRRVNERMMVIRVMVDKSILNLASVYAQQVGRTNEEKEEFYTILGKTIGRLSG